MSLNIYYNMSKIIFDAIQCAPALSYSDPTLYFSFENSNGCFNALFISIFTLILIVIVELSIILGLFVMIANLKNNLDVLSKNINSSYMDSVNQSNYKKKLQPASPLSTSEQSDTTTESSSDSETNNKKHKASSKKRSYETSISVQNKSNSIKLPRYQIYKYPLEEIVVQKPEEHTKKPKKSKSSKQKVYDESINMNDIESKKRRNRSASRHSRHSMHSSSERPSRKKDSHY